MSPSKSYIVCATPRSGSSLLCEALRNTFLAGRPGEYFNTKSERIWRAKWGIASSANYFSWLTDHGTSPNGVFGAKIMWEQMGYFVQFLRQLPQYRDLKILAPDLLATVFPDLFYIWIRRRDKVRQATSDDMALQTGNYGWTGDQKPSSQRRPVFNFNRIDFLYHRIIAAEDAWERYFTGAGITPFQVVYEEFIETYDQTVSALLDYLGIAVPPNPTFGQPRLKKMADTMNDEWVQQYNEMKLEQKEDAARVHRRLARWLA